MKLVEEYRQPELKGRKQYECNRKDNGYANAVYQ